MFFVKDILDIFVYFVWKRFYFVELLLLLKKYKSGIGS